jgi:hypothetical protein
MRTQRRAGLDPAMTAELRYLVAAADREEAPTRGSAERREAEAGRDDYGERRHIA